MKRGIRAFFALTVVIFVSAPPARAETSWCESFAPGLATSSQVALSLSSAHAIRRFFGVGSRYSPADQALAATLADQRVSERIDLSGYARGLPDTCWLGAGRSEIPRLRLDSQGSTAWIYPGKGRLRLPMETTTVVLDLTVLPNRPGMRDILRGVLARLLRDDLALPDIKSRTHRGMTDEYFAPRNIYSNSVELTHQAAIQSKGGFAGPLFVVVGSKMTPEAVEFAGALRAARRAWLVGEPLRTSVAEARWWPVAESGLAFRIRELYWGAMRWPDEIPADLSLEEMKNRLKTGNLAVSPPSTASDGGESKRASIEAAQPYRDLQPRIHGKGDVRASLIVAHGALRLFFPDFAELGDRIDARLAETLKKADALEAEPSVGRHRALLRRFTEALHDGHSFVFALPSDPAIKGYLPIYMEFLEGRALVRRSAVQGVAPGDSVVSIGGRSMRELYAEQRAMTSASGSGYQYDIATRELVKLRAAVDVVVKSARGGEVRTLHLEPVSIEAMGALHPGAPVLRPAGWLTDLGAGDVYYINLSGDILKGDAQFSQALAVAAPARALVLDMRGYPGVNAYETARRLICHPFSSPLFRFISYSSPLEKSVTASKESFEPSNHPSYCGPLALIVGPHTASAAENFSTLLVDAKRVRVFGQSRSAGSNGDIPGIELPGAMALTFSGMEVLHSDGSRFVGRGIVPDVTVPVTAQDLASGVDRVLMAAALSFK